jgi:cellulose biosynthesis protein BcsQ
MQDTGLFVVTVASEKGGVGKTTIATNLAVYLKALCEDLPVSIISFDNHFSVDNMFAIGPHHGQSVAGLFNGVPLDHAMQMGEYGVQFMVSERHLEPPNDDVRHLSRVLARGELSGILIIDTRPILDYFTRSALLAADLVLTPVKDRPSLVNASALQQALVEAGNTADRLWLVPSLIDSRVRLKEGVGIHEFIVMQAKERDFQIVDTCVAKSPKVESLTTNFSSRIHPVLTHGRNTAVHPQLKHLAGFIRERYEAEYPSVSAPLARVVASVEDLPPGRASHFATDCPVCHRRITGQEGYFYQDLRHHGTGFLHRSCLDQVLIDAELQTLFPDRGALVMHLPETGLTTDEGQVTLHLYDDDGEEIAVEVLPVEPSTRIIALLQAVTGREPEEMFREMLMVALTPEAPLTFLAEAGAAVFAQQRRLVLEDMRAKERL